MKHCIICKFVDTLTPEQKRKMYPQIQDLFDHTKEINGITGVNLMPNVIDRPNRYDLVIAIEMAPEALPVYDASKWHKQWKRDYGPLLAQKAIIDI